MQLDLPEQLKDFKNLKKTKFFHSATKQEFVQYEIMGCENDNAINELYYHFTKHLNDAFPNDFFEVFDLQIVPDDFPADFGPYQPNYCLMVTNKEHIILLIEDILAKIKDPISHYIGLCLDYINEESFYGKKVYQKYINKAQEESIPAILSLIDSEFIKITQENKQIYKLKIF